MEVCLCCAFTRAPTPFQAAQPEDTDTAQTTEAASTQPADEPSSTPAPIPPTVAAMFARKERLCDAARVCMCRHVGSSPSPPQTLASVDYLLTMGVDRKERRSGKPRRLDVVHLDEAQRPVAAGFPQDSGEDGLHADQASPTRAAPGSGAQLPMGELMLEVHVHHPEVC